MNNRYLLFGGIVDYPYGGWKDLLLKSNHPHYLKSKAMEKLDSRVIDWYHIVDIEVGEILFSGSRFTQ